LHENHKQNPQALVTHTYTHTHYLKFDFTGLALLGNNHHPQYTSSSCQQWSCREL